MELIDGAHGLVLVILVGPAHHKYTAWLQMYVRASAGPPGADTPNKKTGDTATCLIPQGRASPAAASPRRKHRQHRPPWRVWAALLRLTHAHPPGTSSAYRHQHAAGLLPEAGRGVHPDVTAGRRARFPLLSVRHDAARFLRHQLRRERAAAPQTPERAADTVMPSKTGGRITLCPPEWKRGILYTIIKKNKTIIIRHWEFIVKVW